MGPPQRPERPPPGAGSAIAAAYFEALDAYYEDLLLWELDGGEADRPPKSATDASYDAHDPSLSDP